MTLARQGNLEEATYLAQTLWQQNQDDYTTPLLLVWLATQGNAPLAAARWAEKARWLKAGHPAVEQAWKDLPPIRGKMLVECSGQVVWPFKKINLPIAQAIKENKVAEKDLIWAAQKANQPLVRWAAAVASARRKFASQTMTPQEARDVTWPFRQINQPLGKALDAHKIDFGDLCYAIAHGYNELPLAAAIVAWQILDDRAVGKLQCFTPQKPPSKTRAVKKAKDTTTTSQALSKPVRPPSQQASSPPSPEKLPNIHPAKGKKPVAKHLQIIRGSTYLREQYARQLQKKTRLRWVAWLLLLLAMAAGFYGGFTQRWIWAGSSIVLLFVINFVLIKPFEKAAREAKNLRKGLQGEAQAIHKDPAHLAKRRMDPLFECRFTRQTR